MSTVDSAINSVEAKKLPYWKLYKGTLKVSQCDADENPEASPDEALKQFREEVEIRTAGNYRVCVYRRLKGESGGLHYEFTISDSQQFSRTTMNNGISTQDIYAQATRDLNIIHALERIEKKVDALGEFIFSRNDDDDSNDGDGLKKIGQVFGLINQMKGMSGAANAAGSATTTAAASGAANGFRNLRS